MKSHSIIEALEEKIAPAGVVLVSFNPAGNSLTITGDVDANNIQIAPGAVAGTFEVSGAGTLFKTTNLGATSATLTLSPVGNFGALNVNLQDGSDTLSISGVTFNGAGSIVDTTGSGNDIVAFNNVSIGAGLTVNLGAGNDQFNVTGSTFGVSGALAVLLGTGNDVFSVANTVDVTLNTTGSTTITPGGGADQVLFTPNSFTSGAFTVTNAGGAGLSQTITVNALTTGRVGSAVTPANLSITNSAGNSTISIGGGTSLSVAALTVNGSTGDDALTISNLTATGTASIGLLGGTNSFTHSSGILSVNQLNYGTAVGSTGSDTVNIAGTTFAVAGSAAGGASATFHLGDGTNSLTLAPTLASSIGGSLVIDSGTGNNTFNLNPVVGLTVGGGLTLTSGIGNDTVNVRNLTVGGIGTVSLGAGTNAFNHTAGNVTFGQFTYGTAVGSTGNDTVSILGNSFNTTQSGAGGASANFHLGAGVNSLTFSTVATSNIAGNLMIDGGDGGNTINLQSSLLNTSGSIGISTGSGNDSLTISSMTNNFVFNPNLGAGNNTFTASAGGVVSLAGFTYGSGVTGTGNDVINLHGTSFTTTGATTLNLGAGTNLVDATSTLSIGGTFTINAGANDDTFHFSGSSTIAGATTINAGNGTNEATFWSPTTTLGSFAYVGGTGLDVVELGNFESGGTTVGVTGLVNVALGSSVGALGINGATIGGALTASSTNTRRLLADEVAIYSSSVTGNVNITLGSGTSIVDLQSVTMSGTVIMDTGAGNDLVLMDQGSVAGTSTYGRSVTINLGTGDDFLTAGTTPVSAVSGNTFGGSVTINGGTGFDTAYILDVPAVVGPPAIPAVLRGNTFNGGTPVLNGVESKGF